MSIEFNDDTEELYISRLLKYKKEMYWTNDKIGLNEIKRAIKNNISEVCEPYDNTAWFKGEFKSTEWHLGRIIYFINHPKEITAIQIDNKCCDNYILPIPIIEDGNHRYLAAAYLGFKKIKAMYCGRIDVLKYLQKKTNKIP